MSFWKKAGELAVKAGSAAVAEGKAAKERSQQYDEEMPKKSDRQLALIIKNELALSPVKATAAAKEFKKRGLDAADLKALTS